MIPINYLKAALLFAARRADTGLKLSIRASIPNQ